MSKIALQSVSSVDNTLLTAINNNNATLTAAIDNTLSRDGTSPNPMTSTLDMNSNPIINIPFATSPTQPVALGQITPNTTFIPVLSGDVVSGSFNGTTLPTTIQPAVVTGSKIASATVTGSNLVNNTITNTQLASGTAVSNLGFTPVQAGTGIGQGNNQVKIGWGAIPNNNQVKVTIDTTDEGSILTTNTISAISGGGTTNFLRADGTWTAPGGGVSSTIISGQVLTTSATVTIPTGATRAHIWLVGGTGGSGGTDANASSATGGTGGSGYCEHIYTGLTPGNTIVWTQGGAGTAGTSGGGNGGNGGASSIASGSQIITTITANGSNGSLGATAGANTAGTAGGTATGGNIINNTGVAGSNAASSFAGGGGINSWKYVLAAGAGGVGNGGTAAAQAGQTGQTGTGLIIWYA